MGRCTCEPPFKLFPFPTERRDSEGRKVWIRAVNRADPKSGKNWTPKHIQGYVQNILLMESQLQAIHIRLWDWAIRVVSSRAGSHQKIRQPPTCKSEPKELAPGDFNTQIGTGNSEWMHKYCSDTLKKTPKDKCTMTGEIATAAASKTKKRKSNSCLLERYISTDIKVRHGKSSCI